MLASALRHSAANGLDRARHNDINAELPELGRRLPRVALDPPGLGCARGREAIAAYQSGIDRQRERRVGEPGVQPDLLVGMPAPLQCLRILDLDDAVVVVDRV